jgi:hypothetical protein
MRVKGMTGALALGLLLLAGGRAEAVSIGVVPSDTTLVTGELLTVDVVVSGLGAGAAPTISSFDLDLAFAAPQLSFVSIAFGTGLGTGAQVLSSFSLQPGPLVDFAAASLLGTATLDATQPASFVLATLTFQAGAAGEVALAITQAVLANTIGAPGENQIPVDTLVGADVTVVPEPGTLALVAAGLAALARRRR